MGTTVRLPEALMQEASDRAAKLGVSFNALVALALRDYLAGRPAPFPVDPSAPRLTLARLEVGPGNRPQATFKAPKKPRMPCPCGSGQQWRHCHGKGA
jgi:hypothetical protein